LDLTTLQTQASLRQDNTPTPPSRRAVSEASAARSITAAERVLAAELQARGEESDALSMMVSSIARMVQAGKSCDSRWKAS
jgi:hypothetical protein